MLRRLRQVSGLHGRAGTLFLTLAVAFAGLGAVVQAEAGPLASLDRGLGEELHEHRETSPLARSIFLAVTDLGDPATLAVVAGAAALACLAIRRRGWAVLWTLAGLGAWLLTLGLKLFFARPRPPFLDPEVVVRSLSFPSGHALGSTVVYGLLAVLIARFATWRWLRWTGPLFLGGLVLAIAFSRVYLGAHYLTDVVGGLCCGGAWLAACLAAWNARQRRLAAPPPAPAG